MLKAGSHAHWFSHINGVQATPRMQDWLTDEMSLTQKLTQRSRRFRVQRLAQERALPLHDEYVQLALPRRIAVQQREVFLRCDDEPVVYAHTIVPLSATASDWPFFSTLGERSLGTTLFGDPRVQRGRLQYARLPERHPLVRRAAVALKEELRGPLFARRCLYKRHAGLLLVTEVFLPAIDLIASPAWHNQKT
jgi:chorismate--pyruvate lyase